MKKFSRIILFSTILMIICCKKKEQNPVNEQDPVNLSEFISAVDISRFPEISEHNHLFYDLNGNENDFLNILKDNGINTIRLRLWVNPNDEHSGFNEVKHFSQDLKNLGFKTWLSVHYSDTWADPGSQETPLIWQNIPFNDLCDSVYNYTQKIVVEMEPDYIQIGNEINSGFLHPYGNINNNFHQFKSLVDTAVCAVKSNLNDSEIILHYAGIIGSEWFFNLMSNVEYDIIGLSYYPIWHGKSLLDLKNTMQTLGQTHNKEVIIAETAYPFILSWNDYTNNIVGSDNHLILPDYPASPAGQRAFIKEIKSIMVDLSEGVGFCYWGAELIAWKGNQATDASPWENQALFDFQNQALPVINEF